MNIEEIMKKVERNSAAEKLVNSGIKKLSDERILEAIKDFEQAIELLPQYALAKSYEALCRLLLISQSGEVKETDNKLHLAKATKNIADVITGLTDIRNYEGFR